MSNAIERVNNFSAAENSALRVMQFLAREAGDKLWCHPTVGTIASAVALSTRQVQRILRKLEAGYEIVRTRRGFTLLCRYQIEVDGHKDDCDIVGLDAKINGRGVIGHYRGDISDVGVTSRGDMNVTRGDMGDTGVTLGVT